MSEGNGITLRGVVTWEFASHTEWVRQATRRVGHRNLCLDAHGRVCHNGKDMVAAAFPVRVVRMERAAQPEEPPSE